MTTFAVAYLLVWGAVLAYVVRMAAQQQRIERQLAALERQLPAIRQPREMSQAA